MSDDTGWATPHPPWTGAGSTPFFATGDIIAFDMNGNKVWGRNLGVPQNHYGHSASLQVWGNKVIVQYDTSVGGRLLALNSASGQTIWDVSVRFTFPGPRRCSPKWGARCGFSPPPIRT
ncbi:MAG: hypothetical protein R2751_15270 [Bacteroidales bacterium]